MLIPLCLKFLVHTRSHMRLRLVAVDTAVEHTESIGKHDEELKYGAYTGHPVSLAVCETVVEPVLDTKSDKGDNIDRVCET